MSMLKIHGFDRALIGIATVWQRSPEGGANRVDTLIYDGDILVEILMGDSHLSYDEALEYISFNIEGAYVGETTPIITWRCDMEKVDEIANEEKHSDE
jgi:hypothetical protein